MEVVDQLSELSVEELAKIRTTLFRRYGIGERGNILELGFGVAEAGRLVEDTLATIAASARALGIRRFVVAGGETSGAVTHALGISRLDIGKEIAPGVPWCFATSDNEPIAITLKSGNFGSENFFAEALASLSSS